MKGLKLTDYKMLALFYLRKNRKRSWLTIAGVALTVMVLYVFLNICMDYYVDEKAEARKQGDYEIVLYTEKEEQVQSILADDQVKSAYVGTAYQESSQKKYDQALFVNTKNPYRMRAALERLCSTYGVEGELNSLLAEYYFNDGDDNMVFILVMFVLLIAYVFAIVGVGIIRNSIQLFSLEQIKDYGILRCIGATKGQLRAFIFRMGEVLELAGILIGIIVGYPIAVIIGFFLHNSIGFHVLPIGLILFVFLGDMYFVMRENSRFVNKMSPIEAVKGQFRIQKEKLKVRGNGLAGTIFGVEGAYARKNLLRNPGRFQKSVVTIGMGIAAVIAVASIGAMITSQVNGLKQSQGEYPVNYYMPIRVDTPPDVVARWLPSEDVMKRISDNADVETAKKMYVADLYATSAEQVMDHLSEEYTEKTIMGSNWWGLYQNRAHTADKYEFFYSRIGVTGYDDKDWEYWKDKLVEGTLDISEQGIVLVRSDMEGIKGDDEYLFSSTEYQKFQISDYKLGDTITIVNTKRFREMVEEEKKAGGEEENEEQNVSQQNDDVSAQIAQKCWQQLIDEGDYKTYTVEGIVEADEEVYGMALKCILPLKQYQMITGLEANQISGMKYQLNTQWISQKLNDLFMQVLYAEDGVLMGSEYITIIMIVSSFRKGVIYIGAVVGFIVILSAINIINTTAGNLYLRRKEFAQLRVIGMSKKRLIYTVMLEGILTTIAANLFGILLATGISYYVYTVLQYLYNVNYTISWGAVILSMILSTFLLCGSVYFPLRRLPMDMAGDLTTDGD